MEGKTIIERIDIYLKTFGLSDNRFHNLCGLSVGTLTQARKNGGTISQKSIEKILKSIPNLSKEWLLFGHGQMLVAPGDNGTINNTSSEIHNSGTIGNIAGTNNGSMETTLNNDIISKQQETIKKLLESNAKKDEQIDKLIELLSKQ